MESHAGMVVCLIIASTTQVHVVDNVSNMLCSYDTVTVILCTNRQRNTLRQVKQHTHNCHWQQTYIYKYQYLVHRRTVPADGHSDLRALNLLLNFSSVNMWSALPPLLLLLLQWWTGHDHWSREISVSYKVAGTLKDLAKGKNCLGQILLLQQYYSGCTSLRLVLTITHNTR